MAQNTHSRASVLLVLALWICLAHFSNSTLIRDFDSEGWSLGPPLTLGSIHGGSHQRRQVRPLPETNLGPRASLGPAKSEIISATWNYKPGIPPSNIRGDIFLWAGLYDDEPRSEGDALQVVVEGHSTRYMRRTCEAGIKQWCIRPYVVHGCCLFQSPTAASIDPSNTLLISIHKKDGPGGLWHQSVKDASDQNKELFSFVKGNTPVRWFGAAAESRGGNNGTTDIQIYSDITITLRDPDLDFGKTAFTSQPTVYMAPPITKDSGKSWFVRYLLIPSMARARPSEIE